MHMLQIWIIFIFTVAEYVECGDKSNDDLGNKDDTIGDDLDEDDNFDVTEQTGTTKDEQKQDDVVQPSTEVTVEDDEFQLDQLEIEEFNGLQLLELYEEILEQIPEIIPDPTEYQDLDKYIFSPITDQPEEPQQPIPEQPTETTELYPPTEETQQEQPIQQHFTPEPEQTEPLDLSIKPTQPQQGQPIQTQQIYPQFSHPVHPPQPIQPTLPIQPQFPQPIQPGYPVLPIIQQPVQPPQPPQIYPQVHHPGYSLYQQYVPPPQQPILPPPTQYILLPPGQPVPQLPIHYIPPFQQQIPLQPTQYIRLPTRHQTPQPAHYVPQPQPIEGQVPVVPPIPTKTIKKFDRKSQKGCETVTFMKKDPEGKLVQMSSTDYKKMYIDTNRTKYKLSANLEQVFCDDELLYEHPIGKPYPSSLILNRRFMHFNIQSDDEIITLKCIDKKWKRFESKIPYCFRFFTRDGNGNEVLITKDQYEVDFSYFECFKYTFMPGIRCHKVVVLNKLVWENKYNDEGFPEAMIFSKAYKVLLIFKELIFVFSKRVDRYVQVEIKTRKRPSKKK